MVVAMDVDGSGEAELPTGMEKASVPHGSHMPMLKSPGIMEGLGVERKTLG